MEAQQNDDNPLAERARQRETFQARAVSRAYLRLDPDFAERKRHYPDGPYRALIDIFCAAEYEPKRGTFRNMAILRAVIGRSARFIPYLFAHHDLALLSTDQIAVVGWEEWQEGNWQVAERMRRVRERRGLVTPDVTPPTVTSTVTPTVTVSSEPLAVGGKPLAVGGKQAASRPASEVAKVKGWLKDHHIAQPVGWEISKLNELARNFGAVAIIVTFDEARELHAAVTCRNYIRWAEQSLSPDQSPGHSANGQGPKGHHGNREEIADAFRS